MSEYRNFISDVKDSFDHNDAKAYAMLIYTDTFEVLTYDEFVHADIDEETLLDLRIFNEEKEFRIYRDYCGTTFYPSIKIIDEDMIASCDVYDDYQYLDIDLKRTRKDKHQGKVRATGGGWYKLPLRDDELVDAKLKIRNYVAYDILGQAYIKAWRLVGFCNEGKK